MEGAFEEVNESELDKHANIIGAHFVFKVKKEEKGKRLKARLCPHGNRDKMKYLIRSDTASVQFDSIRLLLSLAAFRGFRLGCIDIKKAYMQSGRITRDLYVRTLRELNCGRGILWKLKKLPYGIGDAGRQWAETFDAWLLDKLGFERIPGVNQLFVKRRDGDISLILTKLTDDLLLAGNVGDL